MIITPPTPAAARKRTARASLAKRGGNSGTQEKQKEQALKPDIDSAALKRRAKELSTEIQRGCSVEQNEKVERIRAEVENGTYKVDADKIAEKLMEFDFQLEDKIKPD